jgi:hypothetical protein
MTVVDIAVTALPTGTTVFGPWPLDPTIDTLQVWLDRAIMGGENSLTPDSTVAYRAEFSTDGGATFPYVNWWGPFPCGTEHLDFDTGIPMTFDSFGGSMPNQVGSTPRLARVVSVVVGGPVNIAGNVEVTQA